METLERVLGYLSEKHNLAITVKDFSYTFIKAPFSKLYGTSITFMTILIAC